MLVFCWLTHEEKRKKIAKFFILKYIVYPFQVLAFTDNSEREEFITHFKSFMTQESPDLDVIENYMKGKELFETAVTREERQRQLEQFFKAAFARVSYSSVLLSIKP